MRRQIGTVFQDFRLLPNKTVSENVAFALQVIGRSRSEINKLVPETLELVGLDGKGDRMPDELSGGEQQRVAIARAFVNRPMILIADEPTGNLDPTTSVGIMKLLDRINRTGTDRADGHPRRRHRRPDAQARHRAGRRPGRARPGPGQLRLPALSQRPSYDVTDRREFSASMQLRYVFSELGQGLRRNLSMHVAVVLTLFVSLTLVGIGVLLNQQAEKAAEQWGSELQITAFLCKDRDDNPSCAGEVTQAQKDRIDAVVSENPEVASHRFETKEEAFEKIKELLGEDKFEGPNPAATAEDMPESVWITLNDPDEYAGIESAIIGLDGVSSVRDQRQIVGPVLQGLEVMRIGALGIAAFLVVAALLLVANTIRLAAFARRREIGIMRLVGASTLYIALPFLMEALVTAAIAVVIAVGTLAAFMWFGVHKQLEDLVGFIPWIGVDEFTYAAIVVAILGPVLTLLPTLVLTRKYLKV